nr:uncharacterized protein LOC113819162 [Penaeus vannamei]
MSKIVTQEAENLEDVKEVNQELVKRKKWRYYFKSTKISGRVQEFYQELYDSKVNREPIEIGQEEQTEPPILSSEDSNQPNEQARFRIGFSTIVHIHTINQILEKSIEYRLPVCMAFIDCEKVFDSIEILALLKALKDPNGDTISPKLFTAALENILKGLNWGERGININGSYLNHLRFADDIVNLAKTPQELQEMIQELNEGSLKVGMKMNMSKTKIMFNPCCAKKQIVVGEQAIEEVEGYNYLGQIITFKRRISLGCAAYGQHKNILESQLPICLKKKLQNKLSRQSHMNRKPGI